MQCNMIEHKHHVVVRPQRMFVARWIPRRWGMPRPQLRVAQVALAVVRHTVSGDDCRPSFKLLNASGPTTPARRRSAKSAQQPGPRREYIAEQPFNSSTAALSGTDSELTQAVLRLVPVVARGESTDESLGLIKDQALPSAQNAMPCSSASLGSQGNTSRARSAGIRNPA